MIEKLRYKYCNKQISVPDNNVVKMLNETIWDNVQFHDQEPSKLNSIIMRNNGTNKESILTGCLIVIVKTFCSHVLQYCRCYRMLNGCELVNDWLRSCI